MNPISRFAVAVSLVSSGIAFAGPALAQDAKAEAKARKFNISKEARKPISDLQAAVKAKDSANFPALLAAAEAAAKNSDDKYIIAHLRLEHARNSNDMAAAAAAIQAVLASGGADAAEKARLEEAQMMLAAQGGDPAASEALHARRLAADPNNADTLAALASAKIDLKKEAEALDLLQRAIAASKASGKAAPESWYRKSLEIAHKQGNRPLAAQMSQEVLGLFPNQVNLHNAIAVYRAGAQLDKEAQIDLLRLMRSARVLTPGGYEQLAYELHESGYPGEAKAVIEEGRGSGALKGNSGAEILASASGKVAEDRASLAAAEARARAAATAGLAVKTAAAYLGYGDYAKAADLYRASLTKSGVDANLVNTRLGIALALAGQKAEAEAAFRAVTGTRADLAGLWLAWLAQRS